MKLIFSSCILLFYFLANQCTSSKASIQTGSKKVQLQDVPYNIHEFDAVLIMPGALREISGLTFDNESGTLLCVNDELGYIYELDTTEGNIVSKRKFGDLGDYEGISFFKKDLIITRSNGKFYFYDPEVEDVYKIVRTPLNTQNNIEGITYDPKSNQILLACKGSPRIAGKFNETKGKLISAYDVTADTLMTDPYLLIKDKQIKRKVAEIYGKTGLDETHIKQLEDRAESFAPSGLAIHPLSGDLYILSAQRSLLLVVDQQKQIKHVHFLAEDIHVQPEGICFSPQGDMYISNEGKSGRAKIYHYKYKQ